MLFSWNYKGFELLRWYLVKHPLRVNLEDLDFEEVDKEMEADQAIAPLEENALEDNISNPEGALDGTVGGDEVTT